MPAVTNHGPYGGPIPPYGSFTGKSPAPPTVTAVTRLGVYGGPARPYGSFAGKTPGGGGSEWDIAAPLELPALAGTLTLAGDLSFETTGGKTFDHVFTQHAVYGGIGMPYGSFAGKGGAPAPQQTYGTHPWLYPPQEKSSRRDDDARIDAPQDTEPERVEEKPVSRTDAAGYVDPDAKAYSDFLTSKLIAAVTAQESARKIAEKARSAKVIADEKRLESAELAELIRQAEIELMAAVEEERRIKQEIQDFDLAYVMAMLAEA